MFAAQHSELHFSESLFVGEICLMEDNRASYTVPYCFLWEEDIWYVDAGCDHMGSCSLQYLIPGAVRNTTR